MKKTLRNNYLDMGTYNYADPNDIAEHFIKDMMPYGAVWIKWGNVPEQANPLYSRVNYLNDLFERRVIRCY